MAILSGWLGGCSDELLWSPPSARGSENLCDDVSEQ